MTLAWIGIGLFVFGFVCLLGLALGRSAKEGDRVQALNQIRWREEARNR